MLNVARIFRRSVLGVLASLGWLIIAAQVAHASPMVLIIDRQDAAVELFFKLPASHAQTIFALPPSALVDDSGTVPFDRLRQGTAAIGDELFRPVDARIAGQPVEFEALSLMVHPTGTPLLYGTPFDGITAIFVCTTPDPLTPPRLEDLDLFTGFIAYTDDPNGVLQLTFPLAPETRETILIRQFENGMFQGEDRVVIEPGDQLILRSQRLRTSGSCASTSSKQNSRSSHDPLSKSPHHA